MPSIYQVLLDEISLEGLEGITFESLWVRLEQRIHFLSENINYVDKDVNTDPVLFSLEELQNAAFLNCIFAMTLKYAKTRQISFFQLPKRRPKVELYDRAENYREFTGTIYYKEKNVPKDPFKPMVLIVDGEIRGSCRDYNEREDITNEVLKSNITTVAEFETKYPTGIMVANANNRSIALFGPYKWQQYLNIKPEAYMILESIGRKRNYGEMNYSLEAPQFEDPKIRCSFYKYRDLLVNDNLIITHRISIFNQTRANSAHVLYLPRFRPVQLNKLDLRVVDVMNFFVQRQSSILPFNEVFDFLQLGFQLTNLKESKFKSFQRFLKRIPELFTIREAVKEEEAGEGNKEKYEIVFNRPLDRVYTVCSLKEMEGDEAGEEKTVDENEDDNDVASDEVDWHLFNLKLLALPSLSGGPLIDPNNVDLVRWRGEIKRIDEHFVSRVYQLIRATETRGITLTQLKCFCDVPKLEVRHAITTLNKTGRITFKFVQLGRNKTRIYMAHDAMAAAASSQVESLDGDTQQSERFNQRCQHVIDYVRQEMIMDDIPHLRRYMQAKEAHLNFKIDIKTLLRLLAHLQEKRRIHFYAYRVQPGSSKMYRNIYFAFVKSKDFDSTLTDMIHDHLLLRFKFEFFFNYPKPFESMTAVNVMLSEETDLETVQASDDENSSDEGQLYLAQQTSCSFSYGYLRSKIEKAFEMYRFLFFLLTPGACIVNETEGKKKEKEYRHRLPKLWKIFNGHKCNFFDVIIYMPLKVFCKLCIIRYNVPDLVDMLNDPKQANLLLYEVKPSIRQYLLYNRRAFADLHDTLNSLKYLGLLELFEGRSRHRSTSWMIIKHAVTFASSLTSEDAGPVTYQMETEADIQKLLSDIYHHLIISDCKAKLAKEGKEKHSDDAVEDVQPECPLHPRLSLHACLILGVDKKRRMIMKLLRSQKAKNRATKRKLSISSYQEIHKRRQIRLSMFTTPKPDKSEKPMGRRGGGGKILSTRCTWSPVEDRFLVKCRIASALIDSSSRSVVCVSSAVIQQLLLKHLNIQKGATSIARHMLQLHRRVILRQLVKLCLLELDWIDIEQLKEEDEVKSGDPNVDNVDDIQEQQHNGKAKLFVKVFELIMAHDFVNTEYFLTNEQLLQRAERMNSCAPTSPTMSIETIMSKFDIVDPSAEEGRFYFNADPKNFYDINTYVISNVLLSSLLSIKLSLHRYDLGGSPRFLRAVVKALKRYPDPMVNAALKRLISMELISKNKSKQTKTMQKFSCYSYNISLVYFYKLIRFDIRFDRLDELRVCTGVEGEEDNPKSITELRNVNTLLSTIQFAETFALNALGLSSSGQTPRSIDSEGNDDQNESKFQFHADIPEAFHRIDTDKTSVSTATNARRSVARSMILRREQGEDSNDVSTILRVLPEDIKITHCNVKITTSMEEPAVGNNDTFERLTIFLDKSVHSLLFDEDLDNCVNTYDYEYFDSLDEETPARLIDKDKAKQLIDFIESQNQLGAKLDQLSSLLGVEPEAVLVENETHLENGTVGCLARDRLVHFLQHCERAKVLFGVGVVKRTWVHRNYLQFWVVHTSDQHQQHNLISSTTSSTQAPSTPTTVISSRPKPKEMKFIPKIWKQPNGLVHVDLLMIFINIILSSLNFHKAPHEEQALLEHLCLFMPMVQLMELLEMLVEMGSLERRIVITQTEASIEGVSQFDRFFMSPDELEMYAPLVTTKKKVSIYYDPTLDCYTRVGAFYKHLSSTLSSL